MNWLRFWSIVFSSVRAQYKRSADPERQRIQNDIYALEQDLREVRIAIGGSFTLNETTFYLRDYPMSQAAS